MAKGLTLEQMEFLVAKGLSGEDMLALVKMAGGRSKAAERTARWRAKKNGTVTENVTRDVTSDGHSDASPPPNDIYSNPLVPSNDGKAPPAKRAKVGKDETPAKPDGVNPTTWDDFLKVRKRKRADLTETALAGIASEAEKAGWPLEAALAKCVTRGWQGFEAEWVKDQRPPGGPVSDGGVNPLLRSIQRQRTAAQ